MDLDKFKQFLEGYNFDTDRINSSIDVIDEFHLFLSKQKKSLNIATYDDLHDFSAYLIENNKNSYNNYITLLRFGQFVKNNQLILATMELIDGNAMVNFSKRLSEEFGVEIRNEVFNDIEIPPIGLHPKKSQKSLND